MKFIPYVIMVILLVFGGYQFQQHKTIQTSYDSLNKKNSQLERNYNALKNNSKEKVQNDATTFLKAFYNYEGRPKKEQLNGLATKKLQDTLFGTYDQLDQDYEMPKDMKYKSEIKNVTIYHARDQYDSKAKILATFDSVITINDKESTAKTIGEINLKLNNNKWIVTGYKVLNDVSNFEGN
ncbi:hypothetical protein GFV16_00015 [Bacillus megaterium]|uniref:hypothetical protein n=1 Tax=Priestia megaterium TaxID=1404 RepID=UPI0012936598|nr:hypothetical protein [Priestia megaterium]MQR84328.1 hypothetical protein [Priestia megaterium]